VPEHTIWIDMLEPTPDEERAVERALGVDVPTREEVQEIEPSSRLYKQAGALFMTATVISNADTPRPQTTAVTFVLAAGRLVTVRYAALHPFMTFVARRQREELTRPDGEHVLLGLLDAIVDRIADILERVGGDLDAVSHEIFRGNEGGSKRSDTLRDFLRRIGRNGDMTLKASESLVSLARMVAYLQQAEDRAVNKEVNGVLGTLDRDVRSLSSHATFLSDEVSFLLQATLGMVNIEQTDIIKIFSVAAVMFLPPTLVASIYGMNFEVMPELNWTLGYPFAILLMIVSALLPYRLFKKRGWL
jgi:magnesium transporter